MSRRVSIGGVGIGGGCPIAVQTMYDIPLSNLEEGFEARMHVLKGMGCDVIRFSYPNLAEHDILKHVVEVCPMPVVADIHFDWRNAMDAMDCGVAKIRINPGNIGAKWKTQEIVKKAKDSGTAIRIGLNSGSLPRTEYKVPMPELMVDTALEYISWFEELGFHDTVVSLKASDCGACYDAARLLASRSDYPLHLGVTEAGGVVPSCVRTTWTLGRLLSQGIGSTIRYSITGSIEDEVYACVELLRTLGLRKGGVRIVSCPMCGRKSFDSQAFLRDVEADLLATGKDMTVAIMGCQVNGPGEAKGADIAVTGIGRKVYMYRNGELFKEVESRKAKDELLKAVEEFDR